MGTVPALVDGEVVITDSFAIIMVSKLKSVIYVRLVNYSMESFHQTLVLWFSLLTVSR